VKRLTVWAWCLSIGAGVPAPRQDERDERGDVPGWVLVTIMTAGLVTMLWRFAGPQLQQMLSNALAQVSG
jgi:hypothetical protein